MEPAYSKAAYKWNPLISIVQGDPKRIDPTISLILTIVLLQSTQNLGTVKSDNCSTNS